MDCKHRYAIRVTKNDGLQETDDPNIYLIFGNCCSCGSTIVLGKHILPAMNEPDRYLGDKPVEIFDRGDLYDF